MEEPSRDPLSGVSIRGARRRYVATAAVALLAAACASPPRGPCNPRPARGTLGTICGFANPEDVEAVPTASLVLVSEMRPIVRGSGGGALVALAPPGLTPRRLWPPGRNGRGEAPVGDPACVTPPPAQAFSPHGLSARPTETPGVVRVAVVGHGAREAIELFDLRGTAERATLTWRGCVPLPPDTVGNDVAIAPDGELVVSNFQPTLGGLRGLYYYVRSGLGLATGDVMTWRPKSGWRHLPGSAAPNPNGVAVSPDGSTVFWAETGGGQIAGMPRHGLAAGASPSRVQVIGRPDNLAWSAGGKLLASSHTRGLEMLPCFFGRLPCRTGWLLLEIDPITLHAREVLHHDGSLVGAVASATEFDGCVYLGAVFGDRIGVFCDLLSVDAAGRSSVGDIP